MGRKIKWDAVCHIWGITESAMDDEDGEGDERTNQGGRK